MDERIKKAVKATYAQIKAYDELLIAGIILVVGAWREAERELGALPDFEEELAPLFAETQDPDEDLLNEIMTRRAA